MNLYNLFEAPKITPAQGTTGVMDNQVQSAVSPIGSGTSRWEQKKKPVTMMGVGNNGVVAEARDVQLDEISNKILGDYKKAAGADATAADKAGDIERGNKRFKGIVKATIKQGDNDAKKHKEQGVAEGSKMARADKLAKAPKPEDQQEYDDIEKYRKDLAQSYNKEPNFGIKDDEEENKWWIDYDLDEGMAEGSEPQVGDAVYYGKRLVGWFKGYSEHGKIITEPDYEEMGDEYANRDVYWDPQDKITIRPEQGVAEVSQQTLQSYRKKASAQKRAADDVVSGDADDETWKKNVSLSAKRRQGIDAANKRLGVAEGLPQTLRKVVFSGTGANGGKYEIIQSSPTDFMIHANGKHIDTYSSLQRAMSVLKNEVQGLQQGVAESMGRATPKMPKARDPGHAVLAAKRSSGAAGQHTNKRRQAVLQPKHQKPLTRDMDLGEGLGKNLAGAALAGAMALGGGAQAQSAGDQYQPNMVAHITYSVNGQNVTKDINLGSQYGSARAASDAVTNMLKSKGIKYFSLDIKRVGDDQVQKDYMATTPASDASGPGSIDTRPYRATAPSSKDDYMVREELDESIERRLMQMRHAGYDI